MTLWTIPVSTILWAVAIWLAAALSVAYVLFYFTDEDDDDEGQ